MIASVLLVFLVCFPQSEANHGGAEQVNYVRQLYTAQNWEEILRISTSSETQPAEFDLYRGLALARLKRWDEAKVAFKAGFEKAPRDKRFPEELAGIAYQLKEYGEARSHLKQALRLDPEDTYARDFLATLYFLQGNLDAALLNWNRVGKPKISEVTFDPPLRTDPGLLDRAFAFSPLSVLQLSELETTRERLDNLGTLARYKFDLRPDANESFSLGFHASEKNGWGEGTLGSLLSLLRGLPYQTAYPEYFNIRRSAIHVTSLARWDAQKRRTYASLSFPLENDPKWRFRVYADGRDENWDITQTLQAAASPIVGLKLKEIKAGAEIFSVVSGRWSWRTGLSFSDRKFLNFGTALPQAAAFFTNGVSVAEYAGASYKVLDDPEHRVKLKASGLARMGKVFADPLGAFGQLRGSLGFHWFPQMNGDDYKVTGQFRAGRTFGLVPFDELFQLGVERDNDLWLRAHVGTRDGMKGSAPIGRNYLLWNGELDKIAFQNGLLTLKFGPFLDVGRISDPSGAFVDSGFLADPGLQCKARVLGAVTIVFSYGRNLHSHRNAFYATALQ